MLEFFRLPCTFEYNIKTHKYTISIKRDKITKESVYIDVPENSARILIRLPIVPDIEPEVIEKMSDAEKIELEAYSYMARQAELFIKQIFANIHSKPVDIKKIYCSLHDRSYVKLSYLLGLALSCSSYSSRTWMLLNNCDRPYYRYDENLLKNARLKA